MTIPIPAAPTIRSSIMASSRPMILLSRLLTSSTAALPCPRWPHRLATRRLRHPHRWRFPGPGSRRSHLPGKLQLARQQPSSPGWRRHHPLRLNYLDDGSLLSGSADGITNKNTWTVGNGINLPMLPCVASLLGTTVTNTSKDYFNHLNTWAAADRGCNPEGFRNNAAVGRLILDGSPTAPSPSAAPGAAMAFTSTASSCSTMRSTSTLITAICSASKSSRA